MFLVTDSELYKCSVKNCGSAFSTEFLLDTHFQIRHNGERKMLALSKPNGESPVQGLRHNKLLEEVTSSKRNLLQKQGHNSKKPKVTDEKEENKEGDEQSPIITYDGKKNSARGGTSSVKTSEDTNFSPDVEEFKNLFQSLQKNLSKSMQEQTAKIEEKIEKKIEKQQKLVDDLLYNYSSLSQQLKDVVVKVDHIVHDSKNLKRYFRRKLKDHSDATSVPLQADIVLYTSEKVVTSRGYDITEKINEFLKDRSLNASKLAICICRYIFGDRNMRYWQISKLPAEISADAITDEDQLKKPSKGRPRSLNNKDPESVLLFKKIVGDYHSKCIWPLKDKTEKLKTEFGDKKDTLEIKLRENAHKKAEDLSATLDSAINCANQWGVNVKDRKDLNNDVLYWQLLDQSNKPCKNWKPSWEVIEMNESKKREMFIPE